MLQFSLFYTHTQCLTPLHSVIEACGVLTQSVGVDMKLLRRRREPKPRPSVLKVHSPVLCPLELSHEALLQVLLPLLSQSHVEAAGTLPRPLGAFLQPPHQPEELHLPLGAVELRRVPLTEILHTHTVKISHHVT